MKNRIIVRMKMTVPSATRCLAFVAIASDSSFTLGGFELGENKKIRDSLRISMEVSLRRVFRSSGIFSGSSSAFCSSSPDIKKREIPERSSLGSSPLLGAISERLRISFPSVRRGVPIKVPFRLFSRDSILRELRTKSGSLAVELKGR